MNNIPCTGRTQIFEWADLQAIWQGLLHATWYQLYHRRTDIRLEALDWVQEMSDNIGGFAWCCSLFDADPEYLRRKMLTQKPTKKYAPAHGKYRGENHPPQKQGTGN
jgi:hypothetical protein